MKSFLLNSIAFLFVVVVITFGLKYFLPFKKNYNSAMVDKLELLEKNKSKQKIVLIGGSSIGWGLSAEQIEKATNITTINLGHHAGFGLLDYQEFVISCLTPNDIVIFSPEWVFYDKPDFYDTATLDNLYKNIDYLKITNKSLFAKVKSVFMSEVSFSKNRNLRKPYVYDCLNKNGDIISHCGITSDGAQNYTVSLDHFDVKLFKETFQYITKTNCFILFPPTQELIYKNNKSSFDKLQTVLSNSNLNFIDSISSNIHQQSDFFDAGYHLRCEACKTRTDKVLPSIMNIVAASKLK